MRPPLLAGEVTGLEHLVVTDRIDARTLTRVVLDLVDQLRDRRIGLGGGLDTAAFDHQRQAGMVAIRDGLHRERHDAVQRVLDVVRRDQLPRDLRQPLGELAFTVYRHHDAPR
jgi:hypothetical protein